MSEQEPQMTLEDASQRMMIGEKCARILAVRRSFVGSKFEGMVKGNVLHLVVTTDRPAALGKSLKACFECFRGTSKPVRQGDQFIISDLNDGVGKIKGIRITIERE